MSAHHNPTEEGGANQYNKVDLGGKIFEVSVNSFQFK